LPEFFPDLLRQQFCRKALHARGHRYTDPAGRCRVVKMISHRAYLDPSGENSTTAAMSKVAITVIESALRMAALLPHHQRLKPTAPICCDRRHKLSIIGGLFRGGYSHLPALPRKADMRGAAREGRYGPRADMPRTTSARTNNVGRSTNWCAR
jgi:hypothetical protein